MIVVFLEKIQLQFTPGERGMVVLDAETKLPLDADGVDPELARRAQVGAAVAGIAHQRFSPRYG